MKSLSKELSGKELIWMWFPLVLSGLFNEFYGLINTIITSHYIDSNAIAVMGSVAPYNELRSYIFNGMTLGFGLVVCREFEKKDWSSFQKTSKLAFLLTGILCLFAFLALPFTKQMTIWCNAPASLRAQGSAYLFCLLLDCIFLAIKNILTTIITGMGEMKIVGAASTAGVLMQSGFAYLLIAVLHTDVWGASCSILLTDAILSIILLICLIRKIKDYKEICIRCEQSSQKQAAVEMRSGKEHVSEMLRAGAAKPIMMGAVAFGAFVFQYVVNGLSKEIIAGFAYADTITSIFMAPICSAASLAAALGSQNTAAWKSAPDHTHAKSPFDQNRKKVNMIAYVWSAISILFVMLFAPKMIAFLGESGMSPEIIMAGTWRLRVSIWGFPLLALFLINRAIFHAMGQNRFMPFLGFLEMLFAIIGAVFFIPQYGMYAVGFIILVKWSIPGIVSELILQKHL